MPTLRPRWSSATRPQVIPVNKDNTGHPQTVPLKICGNSKDFKFLCSTAEWNKIKTNIRFERLWETFHSNNTTMTLNIYHYIVRFNWKKVGFNIPKINRNKWKLQVKTSPACKLAPKRKSLHLRQTHGIPKDINKGKNKMASGSATECKTESRALTLACWDVI